MCHFACTSGEDRYVKNFATPLYSAFGLPERTHSVAPPMIEFCGSDLMSGQYGSIEVVYPKTWSVYVEEGSSGGTPVNNYFHPRAVPDTGKPENSFALRIQVVDDSYDRVVKTFESDVRSGKVSASPYSLPKVSSVIGTRFDGQVERDKQGSMVILPLRNMTIKVWTESPNYLEDFNNIILPNLTFAP